MLPHDPDIATPHRDRERLDYTDDGFAGDRRPTRVWTVIAVIIVAAAVILGLWWGLVANDYGETGDVTSLAPPAVMVRL
jgi:hypothetical protein